MARGSSGLLDLLPPSCSGACAGGGAGAGLGPPDRCRGPAVGHPLAGQAGALPMGGADPPDRLRPRTGAEGPADPAEADRDQPPPPAERPAPRDQPEAGALAAPPAPLDPFGAGPFGLDPFWADPF